jgi:NADH dehydrogenase
MRIAITGGSGFVGSHLGAALKSEGIEVVAIARGQREGTGVVRASIDDVEALAAAFAGCDAIAHLAGINRELGTQTYQRVHVDGTRAVIEAAKLAGVRKIVMLSFLRARPDCGSPYHESKWAAERLVRESGLDYTIVKAGMIYGRGDHMLDHLSHSIATQPLVLAVGLREKSIRPLPIADLVPVLRAALVDGRMSRETVAITGAEELLLTDAVRRVAHVLGRPVFIVPAPLFLMRIVARFFELTMHVPLVARAQIRILEEGVVESLPFAPPVPDDLTPRLPFSAEQIRAGLPERGRFTLRDLRCYSTMPR